MKIKKEKRRLVELVVLMTILLLTLAVFIPTKLVTAQAPQEVKMTKQTTTKQASKNPLKEAIIAHYGNDEAKIYEIRKNIKQLERQGKTVVTQEKLEELKAQIAAKRENASKKNHLLYDRILARQVVLETLFK